MPEVGVSGNVSTDVNNALDVVYGYSHDYLLVASCLNFIFINQRLYQRVKGNCNQRGNEQAN
jgi:hypothetical protein